jgi:hypothetical protein
MSLGQDTLLLALLLDAICWRCSGLEMLDRLLCAPERHLWFLLCIASRQHHVDRCTSFGGCWGCMLMLRHIFCISCIS